MKLKRSFWADVSLTNQIKSLLRISKTQNQLKKAQLRCWIGFRRTLVSEVVAPMQRNKLPEINRSHRIILKKNFADKTVLDIFGPSNSSFTLCLLPRDIFVIHSSKALCKSKLYRHIFLLQFYFFFQKKVKIPECKHRVQNLCEK